MSFNFPDNPTPGQSFEPTAGTVYIWTPPVWKRLATATVAPIGEAPVDGELYGRQDGEWEIVVADVEEAPTDGEQYVRKNAAWEAVSVDVNEAPIDGLTYGRKNAAWATIVGGAVISDTPPGPPLQAGQFWYEADSGNTYVWYVDADSSQWVQVNIQPAAVTTVPPGLTANIRNRIVNPAMQVSQEYGNSLLGPTTALLSHAADQWTGSSVTSPGTAAQQRVQVTTPNGSRDRIRFTIGVAKAALAAADYLQLRQSIEGVRMADFRWGTAFARQAVARVGFKGPAGTYGFNILNANADRGYIVPFTISAAQANLDTEQVFVIPGCTDGVWPVDTTQHSYFRINLGAGTSFQGAAGVWQNGPAMTTAAQFNGMASTANVFEIFDCGLYLDPLNTGVAPRFEMPDEIVELTICQRYWEPVVSGVYGYGIGGGQTLGIAPYKAAKRITPATAITSVGNVSNATAGAMYGTGPLASFYGASVTATGTVCAYPAYININARM